MEQNQEEAEDEEEEMPGWGHWALPQEADVELHPGEFMALHDLMEPLEEEGNLEHAANSSLTVSLVPPDNSVSTDASANGPLAPILPDLNLNDGPELAQQHP